MKNRVEYGILIGLIVVLTAYIFLRKDQEINYTLPKMTKFVKDDLTKVTYGDFNITKSDGIWYLPSGFELSDSMGSRILNELSNIKLIDKISETDNYKKFGIEDSNKLNLYKNDRTLVELYIGKTSSTGNYTYVRFPGVKGVFSIRGNFSELLDKSEDELRSKLVLSLDNVTEITINQDGNDVIKTGEEVEEIVSYLDNLQATGFEELERGNILLSVAIKGQEDKTLIIYEGVDGKYPATSSQVEFHFTLSEWVVNKLKEVK